MGGRIQQKKQWEKIQVVAGLQSQIQTLSREIGQLPPDKADRKRVVLARFIDLWAKLTGGFVPDPVVSTTNNLLVVSREQSDDIWADRLRKEQRKLHQKR